MRTSLNASWTHPLNTGFNMLPADFFVSCFDSVLGYSTGDFQTLQPIVFVVFAAMD